MHCMKSNMCLVSCPSEVNENGSLGNVCKGGEATNDCYICRSYSGLLVTA